MLKVYNFVAKQFFTLTPKTPPRNGVCGAMQRFPTSR